MDERGFFIQELCAVQGISLNRPKQKEKGQYSKVDATSNSDKSTSLIYSAKTLNKVWPINDMDINMEKFSKYSRHKDAIYWT